MQTSHLQIKQPANKTPDASALQELGCVTSEIMSVSVSPAGGSEQHYSCHTAGE